MAELGLPQSISTYNDLISVYKEIHRHYHTVEHIESMLTHLDEVRLMAEYPNEVELAIWFHDAIYNPLSAKNEVKSARWAMNFLADNRYRDEGIHRVYDLINATKHNVDLKHQDEKLIVDIDLTILGSPASIYDEFERNVRKEYKWVPWFLYKRKRKILLKSFLAKSNIYNLNYFQEKYEHRARDNMKRAIQRL